MANKVIFAAAVVLLALAAGASAGPVDSAGNQCVGSTVQCEAVQSVWCGVKNVVDGVTGFLMARHPETQQPVCMKQPTCSAQKKSILKYVVALISGIQTASGSTGTFFIPSSDYNNSKRRTAYKACCASNPTDCAGQCPLPDIFPVDKLAFFNAYLSRDDADIIPAVAEIPVNPYDQLCIAKGAAEPSCKKSGVPCKTISAVWNAVQDIESQVASYIETCCAADPTDFEKDLLNYIVLAYQSVEHIIAGGSQEGSLQFSPDALYGFANGVRFPPMAPTIYPTIPAGSISSGVDLMPLDATIYINNPVCRATPVTDSLKYVLKAAFPPLRILPEEAYRGKVCPYCCTPSTTPSLEGLGYVTDCCPLSDMVKSHRQKTKRHSYYRRRN
eukprot:jgi/Chrzof1/11615/Cz06g02110.t1